MHLVLPAGSLRQVSHAFGREVWPELFLKPVPGIVPFCRSHVRVRIDDMLEIVDNGTVRDERQRIEYMHKLIFSCIRSKEPVDIFPCKEFHAH